MSGLEEGKKKPKKRKIESLGDEGKKTSKKRKIGEEEESLGAPDALENE